MFNNQRGFSGVPDCYKIARQSIDSTFINRMLTCFSVFPSCFALENEVLATNYDYLINTISNFSQSF